MTGAFIRRRILGAWRENRNVRAQRKTVKAQKEGAKERGRTRNQTCQHHDLVLPASRTVRTLVSVI